MAKKKDSVALFEVIQKARQDQAKMDVPNWMGGESGVRPGEAKPEQAPAAQAPAKPRAPVGAPAAGEPIVAVAGDRLRISLNTVSCAAAALGLLAVLAGTFALGWWAGRSGRPAAKEPGGELRDRVPFSRHVLGGADLPREGGATRPAGSAGLRKTGKWYLVIQGLAGVKQTDLDEAKRIVAFCVAHGEPATVARYTSPRSGKQRYIVWSLTAFDSGTSAEAKAHGQAVEALGKQYFAKHKTYDFRQRTAAGKFDPWYETHRE